MKKILKATAIKGTLRERSVQITAYTDDLAFIARNKTILTDKLMITYEATKRKLEINQTKTMYIKLGDIMFSVV